MSTAVAPTLRQPLPVPLRLSSVAMIRFPHGWRLWLAALAALLAAAVAAAQTAQGASAPTAQNAPAQTGKPQPLKPDLTGLHRNHRLILKDGSYQNVTQYQIIGDRVRYYSRDRGDWEEIPVDMVDWPATEKWERDHATAWNGGASPAMQEAAKLDEQEAAERNDLKASMPLVAPGLELPNQDGVWVLDTFQGTPELAQLTPEDLNWNARTRHGIAVLNPRHGDRELDGAHAKVHLHVNDPSFFLSLPARDSTEPLLSKPFTVHTMRLNSAGEGSGQSTSAVNNNHGASSAQSRFAVIQLQERNAVRVVGPMRMGSDGALLPDPWIIPTKVEVMPGKHWLRVQPLQPLRIGEYALVQILPSAGVSPTIWDFEVNPATGDNLNSLGPILNQPNY